MQKAHTHSCLCRAEPCCSGRQDVWPLLTEDAASPRDFLPTTEVSILWGTRWKLLTLAGQSQYYSVRQTHK